MVNINLFIKEQIKEIGSGVYISPEIPEKKLNNAIKAFKCENFYESIVAIQDGTIFGSAKEGFVFTGEKFIHHQHGEFRYSEIESVEYFENKKINDKGKQEVEIYILISKNGETFKFEYLYGINEKKLAKFLNEIIREFDEYKEEDQLKTISEMANAVKVAYMKIVVNMAFSDGEDVTEKELAEILLLMTRLELDRDSRFSIRAYITNSNTDNIEPISELICIIKKNAESSHYKALMVSLVKDLINLHFSTKSTLTKHFDFLDKNKQIFMVSEEEIDLAYDAVENDYKILNEDVEDNIIKKNAKELAAKAAAAGTPLAAVYISGSVIGMSAAGITSGLAALGMGMGMTGGLAVIGIIGVMSYKGVKLLTGSNELDKYKIREMMLHDIIKQTQKTISQVIDDVNFVVIQLNDTVLNHCDQNEKIQKLVKKIAQLQGALKSVDNKSTLYQNSANRLTIPKNLDVDRLKSLTSEPTKNGLFKFIIVNYEMTLTDGKNEQFTLKKDIENEVLTKMAEIFNGLGYFDIGNTFKSKASVAFKGFLG